MPCNNLHRGMSFLLLCFVVLIWVFQISLMAKMYKFLFLHMSFCFFVLLLDSFVGEDIVEESKRSSRVVKKLKETVQHLHGLSPFLYNFIFGFGVHKFLLGFHILCVCYIHFSILIF